MGRANWVERLDEPDTSPHLFYAAPIRAAVPMRLASIACAGPARIVYNQPMVLNERQPASRSKASCATTRPY
ncbi:hypothetical protein [Arthrobacter methylotrophus]|uniref:hypothetical protein n=1 Tax=Arthrobacter methylotrophus TaxID=121291 RepID=UPI0031ECDCA4